MAYINVIQAVRLISTLNCQINSINAYVVRHAKVSTIQLGQQKNV